MIRPRSLPSLVRLVAAVMALAPSLALGQARDRAVASVGDTSTSEFTVGGLRVILRRNTANDVVAANLYLLGGVRRAEPGRGGIEPFLFVASERGTRRFPGERARLTAESLGSTFVVEPELDWTMFGFRALRSTLDSTWTLFADRIMAPALDSGAVELVRAQLLADLRRQRESPDALVSLIADSIAFAGHPYATSPLGAADYLATVPPSALRAYRQAEFVTSRMLLVVVGNVDRAALERLVRSTLATLPKGNYEWQAPPPFPAAPGALVVLRRPLPTNYLLGRFSGPPASNWKDYQALRVASAILSGRLFGEIRDRQNLTYAVESRFDEGAISSGTLYVTTVLPDSVLTLMHNEVERLKTELVDPRGLARLVQGFLTEYFLDNETNAAQGDFLARAALYRGDVGAAGHFVDELRRVTPEDIRRVAREYIHDIRWAYIGDPNRITESRAKSFDD